LGKDFVPGGGERLEGGFIENGPKMYEKFTGGVVTKVL
jgi:hypothetical protein